MTHDGSWRRVGQRTEIDAHVALQILAMARATAHI
jgi:hypothetical protein